MIEHLHVPVVDLPLSPTSRFRDLRPTMVQIHFLPLSDFYVTIKIPNMNLDAYCIAWHPIGFHVSIFLLMVLMFTTIFIFRIPSAFVYISPLPSMSDLALDSSVVRHGESVHHFQYLHSV